MTVQTKYYIGEPYNTVLNDSALIGAVIIKLSREGVGFNTIVDESVAPTLEPLAGNREAKFYPAIGRLEFDVPFSNTHPTRRGYETIMIKFRT